MKYLLQSHDDHSPAPIRINIIDSEIVVGRATVKALSKYLSVSRQHARFNVDDRGKVFIKDLNSSNGVFVNGDRIGTKLKELKIGDTIGFGDPHIDVVDGFVCVLREDVPLVKSELSEEPEVICLDDSDDEVKPAAFVKQDVPAHSVASNVGKSSKNAFHPLVSNTGASSQSKSNAETEVYSITSKGYCNSSFQTEAKSDAVKNSATLIKQGVPAHFVAPKVGKPAKNTYHSPVFQTGTASESISDAETKVSSIISKRYLSSSLKTGPKRDADAVNNNSSALVKQNELSRFVAQNIGEPDKNAFHPAVFQTGASSESKIDAVTEVSSITSKGYHSKSLKTEPKSDTVFKSSAAFMKQDVLAHFLTPDAVRPAKNSFSSPIFQTRASSESKSDAETEVFSITSEGFYNSSFKTVPKSDAVCNSAIFIEQNKSALIAHCSRDSPAKPVLLKTKIKLKKCYVVLTRCDSKNFKWPPGITSSLRKASKCDWKKPAETKEKSNPSELNDNDMQYPGTTKISMMLSPNAPQPEIAGNCLSGFERVHENNPCKSFISIDRVKSEILEEQTAVRDEIILKNLNPLDNRKRKTEMSPLDNQIKRNKADNYASPVANVEIFEAGYSFKINGKGHDAIESNTLVYPSKLHEKFTNMMENNGPNHASKVTIKDHNDPVHSILQIRDKSFNKTETGSPVNPSLKVEPCHTDFRNHDLGDPSRAKDGCCEVGSSKLVQPSPQVVLVDDEEGVVSSSTSRDHENKHDFFCASPVKSDESDHEADEISYSQHEEIIIISDDESYYDFSSSQLAYIKEEPPDVLEDIDNVESDLRQIFVEPASMDSVCCDREDTPENVDEIAAFMSMTEEKHPKMRQGSPQFTPLEHAAEDENSSCESESDAHEPVAVSGDKLFKETLPKMGSSMCDSMYPSTSNNRPSTVRKSIGKTLLTDPKPMQPRPKKLRGREEQFVEQRKYESHSSPEKLVKPIKNLTKSHKVSKESSLKRKTTERRKDSSKLPKSPKEAILKDFKIPRKSSIDKNDSVTNPDSIQKTVTNPGSILKTIYSPIASTSSVADGLEPKKKTSVKVRPEKFGSRSSFLISEVPTIKKSVKPKSVTFNLPSDSCSSGKQINDAGPKNAVKVQKTIFQSHSGRESNEFLQRSFENVKSVHKNHCATSVLPSHKLNTFKPPDVKRVADNLYFSHPSGPCTSSSVPRTVLLNTRDPRLMNRDKLSSVSQNVPRITPVAGYSAENVSHAVVSSSNLEAEKIIGESSSFSDPNSMELVKEFIRMNTKWLQEYEKLKYPPSVVQKGAADLSRYFRNYSHYVDSFLPMIKLEIWEYMYQESKDVFKGKGTNKKSVNRFYFSIDSCNTKDDCSELKCSSLVAEKISYCPREGTIVIMEMKDSNTKLCPLFGYIYKHNVGQVPGNSPKLAPFKNLPEEWRKDGSLWTFSAFIKRKEISYPLKSLLKATGICYIRSKLRLVDALKNLKDSSLLSDILQPQMHTFKVNYPEASATTEYTSCQNKAIKGIASELQNSRTNPKIMLLQGPPGTGKTHTIIGLVEKLLFEGFKNVKLLVLAPSNAAVDEIGCRLIDLNERSQWRDKEIKFIRVGAISQVNPKILPHFLDTKAKKSLQDYFSAERERLNAEITKLVEEIAALEYRVKTSYSDPRDLRMKTERLGLLKKQKQSLKKQMSKKVDYIVDMNAKESILKDCHIVLSTLNSCSLSVLTRTFRKSSKVQFSCCIIDEVTQCTEVEVLQPLIFGIDKLILVGDNKQLPATVISKVACKYGFERSMFERFHIFFNHYYNQSPVFTLTEQFRMHSEICAFPSRHFYDMKLLTGPEVDLRYSVFPIKPYVLLNVMDSQEETNDYSSKYNFIEASVIVNICQCLMPHLDSASCIGIITPYQSQKTLYSKALKAIDLPIEVNTVDGFQGREKEVIIVSCVRANSQSGNIGFLSNPNRLNVAITRARKCLIICGHIASLMSDPEWRVLIDDARSRNLVIDVFSQDEIKSVFAQHITKRK